MQSDDAPTNAIIGAQLDNYRIVEKIGEGGMGAVYRAVDVMLEREVALKFLRPELSREPELVQRFRAEAVLLARLNHHFIAPIFGLHRYGDELFIAMEFIPGETLDGRLKRLERFSPDGALHVTSMVLQALDYAHRVGVIHRDIKPANVILTPSGTVKVMDFGIARVLGADRRTRAGAIVGTIAYMAPEQIQGIDADQRADLYAVGILLYEMLTGHVPFRADTDWALMQAQIAEPPSPLRGQVDVSEALEAAVLKALEKAPDRRYQNAAEFQHALEQVARQEDRRDLVAAPLEGSSPSASTRLTGGPGVANWEETRLGMPTPPPGTAGRPSGIGTPPPPAPLPSPATPAPAAAADLTVMAPSTARLSSAPPTSAGPTTGETRLAAQPPAIPATPPPVHAGGVPSPPAGPAAAMPVAPAHAASPVAAKPKAAPKKQGNALALVVGGVVLLIGLAAVGLVMWQRGQQAPAETAAVTASDPAPPVDSAPPGSPAETTLPSGAADSSAPAEPSPAMPAPTTTPGAPGATGTTGAATTARTANPAGTGAPGKPTTPARRAPATAAPAPAPLPTNPIPAPATPFEPPPVATPSEPAPAAPATPAATAVFDGVRMVRANGPEVDVELRFGPTQLEVRNRGGRTTFHALDYGAIASAEYLEARQTRVFVRTTRRVLRLRGAAGWELRLRLDREDSKPIIAALEKYWGHTVQTAAPEQDQ